MGHPARMWKLPKRGRAASAPRKLGKLVRASSPVAAFLIDVESPNSVCCPLARGWMRSRIQPCLRNSMNC